MDSIRLSQINEALNYDKNINSMVFNLEKKRAAMSPDPIVVPYSQVNAEALTATRAALDQLRVLLDSKRASLSLMIRPGSRVLSQEFAHGASDVGQVELVGQLYNQVVGLYSIGNLTQQTKGLILQSVQQIQKPVAGMIAGLRKVLEELSKVYADTNNPSLAPTATFYFVRCIEALAFYVIIYEQISSTNIEVMTSDTLKPRIWDLINKKKNWQHIAGQKNVDRLFRDFDFGGGGGGPGDGPPGAAGAALAVGPSEGPAGVMPAGLSFDPPPRPPPTLPTAPPPVIPPLPPTTPEAPSAKAPPVPPTVKAPPEAPQAPPVPPTAPAAKAPPAPPVPPTAKAPPAPPVPSRSFPFPLPLPSYRGSIAAARPGVCRPRQALAAAGVSIGAKP